MIQAILAIMLFIGYTNTSEASFKTHGTWAGRPRFKKEQVGEVYFGVSGGLVYANNMDLKPSVIQSCRSNCNVKVHNRPYFEGFIGYIPAFFQKLRIEVSFLGFRSKTTQFAAFDTNNTLNIKNDDGSSLSFDQVSGTIRHTRGMLSLYYNDQFKSGKSGYFFGGGVGVGNLSEKIAGLNSESSISQDFSATKKFIPMFEIAGGFFMIPLDGFALQIKLRYASSFRNGYGPTNSARYNYIGLDIGALISA